MPLSPRGLYKIILVGELHGQLTQTAFHFKTSENSGQTSYKTEMQETMTDFRTNILPLYSIFCSQEWKGKSIIGVTLIPKSEFFLEDSLPNTVGGQASESLPSFCAGLLSLRTGQGGRSRIGRLYLPGVSEDSVSNSRLEPTYYGLLSNFGAALVTRYGPNGAYPWVRLGVFSRKMGAVRVFNPLPSYTYNIAGWTQLTSTVARPEIATIRKRKLAKGQ